MMDMLAKWHRTTFVRAIFLILAAILMNGCAGGGQTLGVTGGQTLPQEVTTEYLLSTAGFKRLAVSDDTPKLQALLTATPPGQLVTYSRDGDVYHIYADKNSHALYMGDEAAYQRYEGLAKGRNLCVRVPGTNQAEFWGCMQEYQER